MKLSKRLSKIVELVPQSETAADIGCDHAYVAIALIQQNKARKVLACDVRQGPLEIARKNIEEAGCTEQIELRLGDGLYPVKEKEADTVIIAGMGGDLIISILQNRLHEFERFILSPQSELDRVRHFLHENDMRITDEHMVCEDGKYYTVMEVEQGTERYQEEYEYVYGRCLLQRKDDELKAFLKKEYLRYAGILKQTQTETVIRECDMCIRAMQEYRTASVKDIMGILNQWAPLQAACDWDNPGLLIGRSDKEVERIYVALDATAESIEAAVESGCDMMVTHHPMLFKAVKQINDQTALGRKIMDLVKNDISLFAMHTNFDSCPGGMADLVCERLGMKKTGMLEMLPMEGYGIGFTAELAESMSCKELAELVRTRFGLPMLECFDAGTEIRTLAVCPGSGRSMLKEVIARHPDVFISGDMGHHEGLDLLDEGISLIDAGHYGLEHIFVEAVASYLKDKIEGISVVQQEKRIPYQLM